MTLSAWSRPAWRAIAAGVLASVGLCCASPQAWAQSYPNRPLRLIVPYAPGGNIDLTARLIAPAMSKVLGQNIVVDNRPGATGAIGTEIAAKAPADGYTLVMAGANLTIVPFVYKQVGYDPVKDFTAIGGIMSVGLVLAAAPNFPANNLSELRALAATRQVSTASGGNGSTAHVALEAIRSAGVPLVHVPFNGGAPALTALMGGHVDTLVDTVNTSLPRIRDKSIKVIAQLGQTRSPLLPDVPTMTEQGITGVRASTWTGLFTAAGLPQPVLQKLAAALEAARQDPAVRKRFEEQAMSLFTSTQPEFAAFVQDEIKSTGAVIKAARIAVE